MDELKKWLDGQFDHRTVNDVLPANPTAENMARAIYEFVATRFPEVSFVGVSETPKTWAFYSPQNLTLDVLETAVRTLPEPMKTNFLTALSDATGSWVPVGLAWTEVS